MKKTGMIEAERLTKRFGQVVAVDASCQTIM